jgi:DNA-binding NtrC family response regulator
VPVDVRVVAATHHDLRQAVKDKRFREDLYYRLAVIEIAIPPLRERMEDIVPLAEHFLARTVARSGRHVRGFSASAVQRMVSYGWPGNVRELENAVERAVALAQNEWISPDDLPHTLSEPIVPTLFESAAERMMSLEELQVSYVRHVLQRFGGNKVRAAAALGINRRTIQRWLGEKEEKEERDETDERE